MPLSEDEKNTRMRDARITRGLSQQELAALVGATRQTIGLIEASNSAPPFAKRSTRR